MTVEDMLRRGNQCEAAGDLEGAEAAYRDADGLEDAEGAILLGGVLKKRGDLSGAADAYRRAEGRGHRDAGWCLGNLLSDSGDHAGAVAACERSIAAGSSRAVLNLGLMLAQHGARDEALPYLYRAEETNAAVACWAVGKILEERDDLAGAAGAYRRSADAGSVHGAFALGVVLEKQGDREGARGALLRAQELGHENAGAMLEQMDIEADARATVDVAAKWARLYLTACDKVMDAANACLEVANRAIGARNMATQRPQHEISIRNFTKFAEEAELEFAPLYSTFDEACVEARETAGNLLAADPENAELVLAVSAGDSEQVLDQVATVKAILGVSYGPKPAAFVQGVEASNALMENPLDEGNIYRPLATSERTCPWCAETIKAAAVICRFCGRDVQTEPGTLG